MHIDRRDIVPLPRSYGSGFDRILPPNDGLNFLKWWSRRSHFPVTLRRFGGAMKAGLKLASPFDATNPRVEDMNDHMLRDIGLNGDDVLVGVRGSIRF